MIAYAVLGLSLLAGSILLVRWFVAAEPSQIAKAARWILVGLAIGLGVGLVLAGRYALVAFLVPALIPLILNTRALLRRMRTAAGPTPGQSSEVDTRFLKMHLDHDTGEMNGAVLEGRFRGRMLDELGLEQLIELWRECRAEDPQSAAVLEAYLDRSQGEAWREAAGGGEGTAGQAASREAMSREEAYEILGLEPGASAESIHEAHRRLMQKIHPDHGGSNYLAAKINQAKDLLLR